MQLNINTDAAVVFTNKLEKMHKSALPSAIRGALNKAVFDVKTKTMPKSADAAFENRQANFFRANSKFENASGFNVDQMKATVGFTEQGLNGDNNYAVKDLEQQEYSGVIDKKSFIPTVFARKGGSKKGVVRPNARLSSIKKIINANNSNGKNAREKFVVAASVAGKGGFVLDRNILWRIDSIPKSNVRTKKALIKRTPLYVFKKGRSVKVKQTGFMKKATLITAAKMDNFYIQEATRQIEKLK